MSIKPDPSTATPKTRRAALIRTPLGWAVTLAATALGVYLLLTRSDDILSALPYLLLIACPLMHVFMHGGHGHGEHK